MNDDALPVNRRFRDLDAYLLYLQNVSAPSDGPWYRRVGPDLYKLETGNRRRIVDLGDTSREEDQTFTRQQLLEKFGFSN